MAQLSDCSKALRLLWTDSKAPQFKGYAMRPLGTWLNAQERKKFIGKIMPFTAIIAVPSSKINIKKTAPFELAYVPVMDCRKGQFTADISSLTLFSVSTK